MQRSCMCRLVGDLQLLTNTVTLRLAAGNRLCRAVWLRHSIQCFFVFCMRFFAESLFGSGLQCKGSRKHGLNGSYIASKESSTNSVPILTQLDRALAKTPAVLTPNAVFNLDRVKHTEQNELTTLAHSGRIIVDGTWLGVSS